LANYLAKLRPPSAKRVNEAVCREGIHFIVGLGELEELDEVA
jgi:hypothetical protein